MIYHIHEGLDHKLFESIYDGDAYPMIIGDGIINIREWSISNRYFLVEIKVPGVIATKESLEFN